MAAPRCSDRIGSVSVSCEHRNNDRRGKKVQNNKGDLACSRVRERQRDTTGERGEPGSDPHEPLTRGGAAPDQHGQEHPPLTAAMKVSWAKAASGILPCTASGIPAARRTAALAVVAAAASTPAVAVARGSVLVRRERACLTVVSGEAVTVDIVSSFRRRRPVHRSPCPRTATKNSTPTLGRIWIHANRGGPLDLTASETAARSRRAGRKRAAADVVPNDLDVRGVNLTQEPDLQVGSDHPPGRADHIGQPPGDRPSPPADLQAPRALADSKTLNAPLGKRRDVAPTAQDDAIRPGRNAGTRSPEPHPQPGS